MIPRIVIQVEGLDKLIEDLRKAQAGLEELLNSFVLSSEEAASQGVGQANAQIVMNVQAELEKPRRRSVDRLMEEAESVVIDGVVLKSRHTEAGDKPTPEDVDEIKELEANGFKRARSAVGFIGPDEVKGNADGS